MITFKTVRFKDYRRAADTNRRIEAGEAKEEEILSFAVSLVKEWDFVDPDTGNALVPAETSVGELTMEQVAELNEGFGAAFGGTSVPKAS